MAALYCNNNSNKVRDCCFSHGRRRSCSKAQACLEKILHIISTTPPPSPYKKQLKRGFDIDLNLRLGSFLDDDDDSAEEGKSESLAENSFVAGKTPDGEEEEKEKTATAATDASSDVTEMQKSGGGVDGEVKAAAAAAALNDSLGLLIEAAEMISDRDKGVAGEEEEEEGEKSDDDGSMENDDVEEDRRVARAVEEMEETLPVVRSKRGRSQVLPRRFRDSVLEPWKKSQRSTPAVVIPNNRKRRRPR